MRGATCGLGVAAVISALGMVTWAAEPPPLSRRNASGDEYFMLEVPDPGSMVMDGEDDDWGWFNPAYVIARDGWRDEGDRPLPGVGDLDIQTKMGWSGAPENRWYVFMHIHDDTVNHGGSAMARWSGDMLGFGLDPQDHGRDRGSGGYSLEWLAAPGDLQPPGNFAYRYGEQPGWAAYGRSPWLEGTVRVEPDAAWAAGAWSADTGVDTYYEFSVAVVEYLDDRGPQASRSSDLDSRAGQEGVGLPFVFWVEDGDPGFHNDMTVRGAEAVERQFFAHATLLRVSESEGVPVLGLSLEEVVVDSASQVTMIEVWNDGVGRLTWTVGETAVWMEVTGLQGDTGYGGKFSGTGRDTLWVRTAGDGLNPGVYETAIRILSNGGEEDLPVRMTVGTPPVQVEGRERTPIPTPSGFEILTVEDVPNDQGGWVELVWRRHPNDREDAYPRVTEYGIWRRFDPELPAIRPKLAESSYGTLPEGEWSFLEGVPARGVETYRYAASTLADSTEASGMYRSHFFITASTEEVTTTFDTPVDGGYSVDNRLASTPLYFAGAVLEDRVELVWMSGVGQGPFFEVFRSAAVDVEEEAAYRTVVEPGFSEPFDPLFPYYRVAAVSYAGRRSAPTETIRVGEAAVVGAFPGDFDEDGRMGYADFFLFCDMMGSADPRCDVDANGRVEVGDFLLVKRNFGRRE